VMNLVSKIVTIGYSKGVTKQVINYVNLNSMKLLDVTISQVLDAQIGVHQAVIRLLIIHVLIFTIILWDVNNQIILCVLIIWKKGVMRNLILLVTTTSIVQPFVIGL
jgi:hypothetical protein